MLFGLALLLILFHSTHSESRHLQIDSLAIPWGTTAEHAAEQDQAVRGGREKVGRICRMAIRLSN